MATWIGTPNYSVGRGGNKVKYVVIHWAVGTMASTDATFQSPARQASAHYCVENKNIHQYVRETDTAWHSGNFAINQQSIGIEHSAAPGRPASAQTYETTIALIAGICSKYNLNPDAAIVPHNKFFNTQCPGTMDLNKIKAGVKAKLKVSPGTQPKGNDMVTDRAQLDNLYEAVLRRKRSAKEGENVYLGKDSGWVFNDLMKSGERATRLKNEAAAEAAQVAQINALKAEVANLKNQPVPPATPPSGSPSDLDKENNAILKWIKDTLSSIFNRK